jgi:hypothetical protein
VTSESGPDGVTVAASRDGPVGGVEVRRTLIEEPESRVTREPGGDAEGRIEDEHRQDGVARAAVASAT